MNIDMHRFPLPPHLTHLLPSRLVHFCTILWLMLLLVACNAAVPSVPPTAMLAEITPATPTHTAMPSPTATQATPQVILLAPPGHDEAMVEHLGDLLAGLAESEGLRFQTVSSLNPAELHEGIKLVVALPPDPGISELAVASPETQFLVINNPDLKAGVNISTVNATGNNPDQIGFAAGYLAAVITTDWRVGVLSEQDTPEGNEAQQGYTNGVIFFCGLCRPVYPPFPIPGYPLSAQLTDTSSETEWQTAIGNLQIWNVGTVFVDPEIANEDLYQALADAGMNIIGTGEPPPGLKDHWVASIGAGDPIETVGSLWSDLIQGEGGVQVDLPITLQNVNPDLLSSGREALVEEMLGELSQGYIDTGAGSNSEEPEN